MIDLGLAFLKARVAVMQPGQTILMPTEHYLECAKALAAVPGLAVEITPHNTADPVMMTLSLVYRPAEATEARSHEGTTVDAGR